MDTRCDPQRNPRRIGQRSIPRRDSWSSLAAGERVAASGRRPETHAGGVRQTARRNQRSQTRARRKAGRFRRKEIAMAVTKWGRKESIIWPPHSPIYTYGAVFMALILTGLFLYCRFTFGNSPLQRFYTPTYIRSSVAGAIGTSRRDSYRMLMVAARGIQPRLATNTDVKDGTTPQPGGKPIPLSHSQPALQRGYVLLYLRPEQRYIDASLSAYLRSAVYGSDGLFDLYKFPLLFGLLSLAIQLPFSIAKDVRRRKALRYGRRLKGPEMMTPREVNDKVAGDGIGIKTNEMKTMIRIPQRAEAQHMQIIGDTGAGKTMIMLQILRQIKHRGDSAIVYDPAREFVKRFYDPKNGDVI